VLEQELYTSVWSARGDTWLQELFIVADTAHKNISMYFIKNMIYARREKRENFLYI
jgi:hypothetical protein